MFQLGKAIVSEAIINNDFVCNLSRCKGACCVEGDAGAPLTEEETKILKSIYPKLKPFLRKQGVAAIEEQGKFIVTGKGDLETPLVKDVECAYVVFDKQGIAACGIEKAYNNGATSFRKPLSCHLYPVRIKDYTEFSALNYHKWQICDDACMLGTELQVPVYRFVKDALIRRFGEAWYNELDKLARERGEQGVKRR